MRVLFLKVLRYMRHACSIFRVLFFLKFYDTCVFRKEYSSKIYSKIRRAVTIKEINIALLLCTSAMTLHV